MGWAHPIHPWSNAELDAHYRRDEHDQDHEDLCAQQSRRTDAAPSAVPPVRPGPVPPSSSGAGPESDPRSELMAHLIDALAWAEPGLRWRVVSCLNYLRFPDTEGPRL